VSGAVQIAIAILGLLIPIGIAFFEHRRRSHRTEESVTTSHSKVSRLQTVKDRGMLVVGCTKHNDLFCNYSEINGEVHAVGLYPDLARAFAAEHNLKLVFKPIRWSEIEHAFDRHGCDVVLHVLETLARGEIGDFVFRRYQMSIAGVVRAVDRDRYQPSDLHSPDVAIALVRGEAGWEFVSDDLQIRDDRRRPLDVADIGKMIDLVTAGTADIGVCDSVSIADYCETHPETELIWTDQPLTWCKNSLLIPKGSKEFGEWIDKGFRQALKDPARTAQEDAMLAHYSGLVRLYA
jgi:membrane-bound lytic murein transglycosylase MltF